MLWQRIQTRLHLVSNAPVCSQAPGTLQGMLQADYHACLVIAGCHSLVMANKELVGDPLETACINSIGWRFSSDDQLARPLQVYRNCHGE